MSVRNDITRHRSKRSDKGEAYMRRLWKGCASPVRGGKTTHMEFVGATMASVEAGEGLIVWRSRLEEYQAREFGKWGKR
jgi:hypothetical protein